MLKQPSENISRKADRARKVLLGDVRQTDRQHLLNATHGLR